MGLSKIRKIVLVGHHNEGSVRLFDKITGSYPNAEFLLVIGQGLYYKMSLVASVMKLLKEASWLFVLYRFIELVKYRFTGPTLKRRAHERGIPFFYTRDINAAMTVRQIKEFGPDLLVSLYTMQIYTAPVLKVAKYGSITSHPSILPRYRGLEVFFWVLANDEKETGVSVFFLTERIDAGVVFKQEVIPITPEITASSLYHTVTDVAGNLLVEAIRDIDQSEICFIEQRREGAYYHMPNRDAVKRFRRLGRKFF